LWWCKCECWKEKLIDAHSLKCWRTKSCWCMMWIRTRERMFKHWMRDTKVMKVRTSMKQRCNNPKNKYYYNYGWRGIRVLWKDFIDFWKDMWPTYKEWLTIDRIDNNWNYCKENCKWATRKEQSNNTRNNIKLEINWVIKTLYEWCDKYKINYSTVTSRVERWWDYIRAVITPLHINQHK
jgi:hypothetical protein